MAGRVAGSWRATRLVFDRPGLRRAESAYFLACADDAAFTVALGVVAYRDGGAAAVGLVGVIRMVPAAVGAPLVTAWADRQRRDRVLLVVSLVRAACLAAAAVAIHGGAPLAVVYALAVPATLAITAYRPSHSALLPSLCTTATDVASANVVRGLFEAVATFVGPALAGVLLAVDGASAVFVACAVLSATAAVAINGLSTGDDDAVRARAPGARRPPLARDAAEGLRAVAANRDLRLVFGLGFAQTYVRGALNVFIVVAALDLLDTGDVGVARLSAAIGVGGFVGSFAVALLVGSRRLGRWLATALVIWGTPIVVLSVAPTEAAAFALLAVVGLGNAVIDVPLFTLPVRLAPDDLLARAFGVLESLVVLGVALGSALTPPLIAVLGLPWALVTIGAILPVLGVLARPRLASLDGRLAVRDTEIAALRAAPMFALLPVPTIEHLATRLRRRLVAAGHVVLRQGDPGDRFYIVGRGRAEVIGDDALVRTVGPGECFGEIALLHDVPRTATVRARTPLTVFELGRRDFLAAVAGDRVGRDAAEAVVVEHLTRYRPGT